MLRKVSLTAIIALTAYLGFAQDSASSKPTVTFSGSADAFYRYNFNNAKNDGWNSNSYTSFTSGQNSFELGMASIKAELTAGNIQGVIDLGFGKRAQEFSYPDMYGDAPTALAFIKQAYISYSPSEKLKFSLGKWGTHVGYEVLDPQYNRNYSMSYMFSYGPFSHTGLKAEVALSDNFGLMVGVANPNDLATAIDASKSVLGQFSASFDKFSAYLNYVGGTDEYDGMANQIGLTASATISDKFSIGYDGTVKSYKPKGGSSESWWGSALYFNVDPTDKFGLTLRGEYFSDKKNVAGFGTNIFQSTLSFNFKPSPFVTIIPEFRVDSAKDPIFSKKDGAGTKSTGTFVLGGIFYF
jgi:hypothetical protein